MDNVMGMPSWLFHLTISLVLTYGIIMGGWAAARAGRSPLWVLALLVPWLNILVVWLFAYTSWPAMRRDESGDSEGAPADTE